MVRKGEIGLAKLLNLFAGHHILFLKIDILNKLIENFDYSLFPTINLDTEDKKSEYKKLICELLRLEIIVTTVHYAEVFASNLLAMKKKIKRFHKFLLSYNVPDIINFYQNIGKRRLSYISNLLGYPPLHLIDDIKRQNYLKKYCAYVEVDSYTGRP